MEWDLSVMYDSCNAPAFMADLKRLNDDLTTACEKIDSLDAGDGTQFSRAIAMLQDLRARMQCLRNMVNLTLSAKAGDPAATAMGDNMLRAQQRYEWLESRFGRQVCCTQHLDAMIEAQPILKEHEFFLRRLVSEGKHQMDDAYAIPVTAMQLTGGLAFARLRNELVGSASTVLRYDGHETRLPMTQIERLLSDDRPALRRAAWEAQQAGYAAIEVPMTACLSGIKGEALNLSHWKRFDSPLDWSLYISCIDREILEALKSAIWDYADLFRRYFSAKACALGCKDGLPDWDLRAPMGAMRTRMSFDEAGQLLRQILGGFDARMGHMLDRAFCERWIDWSIRDGKSSDCFNTNLYLQGQSRVMVSFDGSVGSVFTLAHELGHAYHDDCLRRGSVLNCDYPMTLAETASTFNETLMFDALIQSCPASEKLALLDQNLYSIARQTLNMMGRLKFEDEIFTERAQRVLTPDRVKTFMLETQREVYGDSVSQLNPYLWMMGDHLFLPEFHYYNYPYAFGRLFSRGLYMRYLQDGKSFADRYYDFLSLTGTMNVADAARRMDINVYDRQFWLDSLESFRPMVEEYERLILEMKGSA